MSSLYVRSDDFPWGFMIAIAIGIGLFLTFDAAVLSEPHEIEAVVTEKQYRPDHDKWIIIALSGDEAFVLDVPVLTYQQIEPNQTVRVSYCESRLTGIRYRTDLIGH